MAEFDRVGRARFLGVHGFGESRDYFVVHEGRRYDSKAICGVAHGYDRPDLGPLGAGEFSGGAATVQRVLERLGFTVEQIERGHRRNPPWVDEELILALDLFLRGGLLDDTDPAVVELSEDLNRLALVTDRPDAVRFRNPNGVALKLANFAAIDPSYPGRGMSRHGRRDKQIWNLLAGDPDAVYEAAQRVRRGADWRPSQPAMAAVREVPVEAAAIETFAVRPSDLYVASRREQRLVVSYADHLAQRGHRITRHAYAAEPVTLYCDLFDETDRVLYEAKADTGRESIRMAIGQLYDYRRCESTPPRRLALLVPRKPSETMISLLAELGIAVVWQTGDGFAPIDGQPGQSLTSQ